MKKNNAKFIQFLHFFFVLFLLPPSVNANEKSDKISKLIFESTAKIVGENKIGAKVTMDWKSNKEVADVSSYEGDKRTATVETTIQYLGENENTIFPEINSSDHAVVFLVSRLIALQHLSTLVGESDNDLIIKDYLNREVSDIKMMLNGTVDYGAMYLKSRKMRDDKRALFLYQNKGFIGEKLTLMMEKPNIANYLANKTSLISLIEACVAVPEQCVNLAK